ncbi:MAG TPA: glycosyltransferase [Patescibacteria group bacterium]|nr:glycosyltransferase [Patescibacteria group bacterium]
MIDDHWFYTFRNIAVFFATTMLVKYYLFLIISPWYQVKEAYRKLRFAEQYHFEAASRPYKPLVSVVVPAWNEEVGILRTIKSLLKNTYHRIEIVVVNDGSTDGTHRIVTQFLATQEALRREPEVKIHYKWTPNGGKGKALNNGITMAKGEIIVTMDADSVFAPDAIERMVHYFADDTVDAVVGNVKVGNTNTIIGRLQSLEYLFGFYYKRAHCVLGAEYIYGGACAAFRRATTFDVYGLFDFTNKTEDIEMSMRTKYYGLKSCFAEDVVCYTEGASTFVGLINQRLRWKKGRFDTFVKYRRMFFSGDKRHRKTLGWFILPFSLLAELQLLFEPIAVSLLITYSVIADDYVSLALGTLFVSVTYLVVGLFSRDFKPALFLLFPFTWPLFYFLVWIEYLVLIKSLVMSLRGQDIEWQRWERQGIETPEARQE